VPSALTLERVRRDLDVLAHAGLDTATFLAEVYESLYRAVPSDAACVATVDPATRLTTGAFKFGDLAGRYDTDELWGGVAMFRGDRSAPYRQDDVEFVSTLSGLLARGLRVGLLARLAAEPPAPAVSGRPAVMIFDAEARLRQASVGAEARLAELVRDLHAPAPFAVLGSLVAAAWRYAAGATDVLPSSRLRLPSGEWIILHGSPLTATDGTTASVVVTIEEARPQEIVPLLVAAFDLTPRERDVTQQVLHGVDTREIASTLHLSPYTVQDHLKSIFNKTGVTTRRELVARVFFDQYVPRLGSPLSPSGWFVDTSPTI
jgi:DNA-binding CsgD family transcriptional regulator